MSRHLFDLTDRVAVVVGGGSGIGQAVARGFADYGAHVAVADLRTDAAEETASQVRERGRRALAVRVDVTDEAQVARMVEQVMQEFGRIDVLFSGAGANIRKPMLEMDQEEFEFVIRVNLVGVFLCGKHVGRVMVERRRGSIINVASIMGHVAWMGRPAYDASKGGVVNLTRAMALEWAPYNVRVNALCPGYARTPFTRPLWEDPARSQEIIDRTPMRRWGEPEDMVGASIFLASDASLFMTGASLVVDGGWLAW